jgi:putative tricarboxylic transport membrane protein
MDRKHIQTILTDLIFLGIAAYVFYETGTRFAAAGAAKGSALTNAAFYPRILAGLMLVLALCNIAKHGYLLFKEHRSEPGSMGPDGTYVSQENQQFQNILLGFGCLAWFWGYIWFLEPVGYLIATPIMLTGILAALGVRKPWVNLAYTAGGTMGMYLFFQELLDVVLPIGLLARWVE